MITTFLFGVAVGTLAMHLGLVIIALSPLGDVPFREILPFSRSRKDSE